MGDSCDVVSATLRRGGSHLFDPQTHQRHCVAPSAYVGLVKRSPHHHTMHRATTTRHTRTYSLSLSSSSPPPLRHRLEAAGVQIDRVWLITDSDLAVTTLRRELGNLLNVHTTMDIVLRIPTTDRNFGWYLVGAERVLVRQYSRAQYLVDPKASHNSKWIERRRYLQSCTWDTCVCVCITNCTYR